MKKFKLVLSGALAVALSTSLVFAATGQTNADIVANLTGKSVEQVVDQKNKEKTTYGKIAKDANKLEEFKKAKLERLDDNLKDQVAQKKITQAQADKIKKDVEQNQANCNQDGSNQQHLNQGQGLGQGHGQGLGNGQGHGNGQGIHNNN